MRAVIFAVMVVATATSWLAYDARPQAAGDPQVERTMSAPAGFRADAIDCRAEQGLSRRNCQRNARVRFMTRLKQDAALIYVR